MKKWIVTMCLVCLVAGCNQLEERGAYRSLAETVNRSVEAQQSATHEILAAMKDNENLPVEAIEGLERKVDAMNKYVDVAQTAATEAARVYEEKREEDPIAAAVEALRKANEISAPVNPYAPLIEGGLAIATAVAGLFGANQFKKRRTAETAMKETVKGVENFIQIDTGGELSTTLKKGLAKAQSTETRKMVGAIRAEL